MAGDLAPANAADTAPASEPEPPANRATGGDPDSITNATIVLRSEYTDLWERLRRGFAVPEIEVAQVKKAEEWYSARPEYVARMVERSRRYLYHIVNEVEKRGMPTEIALLPMIESAYNPMAYSSSRASGIWQFIPSTGKSYGMKQTWWLDERRDVVAATEGAHSIICKSFMPNSTIGISRWPRTTGAKARCAAPSRTTPNAVCPSIT